MKAFLMEEHIQKNPSDMVGEAKDQIEYNLQVAKKEKEDEKDGSREELEDNPVEEGGQKQLEETTPPDGNDHKSGLVKSNESKRSLDDALGESSALLCYQSHKKCKQVESSGLKLEFGPSDEFNNESVTAVASVDSCTPKEGSGSSGKRTRDRWETQSEDDSVKDSQTCKRKKGAWSNEDAQLQMLGPLQLPDFTKAFHVGHENNPEIQGLKAELVEINGRLHGHLHDDRLEEERSPSPEPIYDDHGTRINTREARLHQKLVLRRQNIISKMITSNPSFCTPPNYKPPKLFKKLYIPVREYPEYNFVGLIIGPRGNTLKRMESETGARISIRGRGFSKTCNISSSSKDDLHVYIEADNKSSLDVAVAMVEKLLIPVEGRNEHKIAQLRELAKLNGTARDENVCCVCGNEGHIAYTCPDLQSNFKVNSWSTCFSATPLNGISPHNSSAQGSQFGSSSGSTQNGPRMPEKKPLMNSLYVGNLPQVFDDNRLYELFSPFGNILEAKAMMDPATGMCRRFGFVEFDNAADAQVALTRMNGFRMDGRVLSVRVARLLSNEEFAELNILPKHPYPIGKSQSVRSRTDRSRSLHFMLPDHSTSFYNSNSMNLFSSTMSSRPSDVMEDQSFSPLSCCSSSSVPRNSGRMHFSGNFADQNVVSSGSSFSENSGSQYQSYFMTPPFHNDALSNPDLSFEDENSFPSLPRR